MIGAVLLTQDLTGRLFGKWHTVKLAPPSQNLPDMVKPRLPGDLPLEDHLQRQLRLYQDGRALRGPYDSMKQTRAAGAGNFMLGEKSFWVMPHDDVSKSAFEVWVPREVPHWLRWPVYAALLCLLISPVRRYYQNNPLSQTKLPYLEALRGVACAVVVLTHFLAVFYREMTYPEVQGKAWYDIVSLQRTIPLASLTTAGTFAVDVFFVLSGLVLYLPFAGNKPVDMHRVRHAFLRRPVRLLGVLASVMFVVWLLRQSGVYFKNSHYPPKDWMGFAQDLFSAYSTSIDYSPVFWTIRIELLGSFGVYLFAMLLGGSPARWAAYLLAIWLSRSTPYANFAFGALLADVMKCFTLPASLLWLRRAAPVIFLAGLVMGLQADHKKMTHGFDHWVRAYLPDVGLLLPDRNFGLAGAILVVSAILLSPWLQRRLSHRWLNSLGRQSYSVYGIHEVLLFTFACWFFVTVGPISPPTVWDIAPTGPSYHLAVLITLLVYLPIVWAASLVLTAFVDEAFIKLSQRFAGWITGRPVATAAQKSPPATSAVPAGEIRSPGVGLNPETS